LGHEGLSGPTQSQLARLLVHQSVGQARERFVHTKLGAASVTQLVAPRYERDGALADDVWERALQRRPTTLQDLVHQRQEPLQQFSRASRISRDEPVKKRGVVERQGGRQQSNLSWQRMQRRAETIDGARHRIEGSWQRLDGAWQHVLRSVLHK
jgi:hypothetical protein